MLKIHFRNSQGRSSNIQLPLMLPFQGGEQSREKKLDVLHPGLQNAIEFLVTLYKKENGYSAINTARSALSSILTLESGIKIGEHPLVTRYMMRIFEIRPALPNIQKYGTLMWY